MVNPAEAFPAPEGSPFDLTPDGMDDRERGMLLGELADRLHGKWQSFLGGPSGHGVDYRNVDYRSDLSAFLRHPLPYVGDAFEDTWFAPYTRSIERAVLDYYARLWHAAPRTDGRQDAYWGYLPSTGSSEGNLYALWMARDYLSGKSLVAAPDGDAGSRPMWVQDTPPVGRPNAYSPVAFHSEETHYSVTKALRMLGIPSFHEVGTERYPHANPLNPGQPWPKEVPCHGGAAGPGGVDVDTLAELVEFFARMGHPVLLNLNYCTSAKGAFDDVEAVAARLRPVLAEHGLARRPVRYGRDRNGAELADERTGCWINIDGALGAMYAPFLHKAIEQGRVTEKDPHGRPVPLPRFDFAIPEVCSIVTSGHKYTGSPWPSGILMTKRGLHMTPPGRPDATSIGDTTFGGSRNALVPLALWDFLARHSEREQVELIAETQLLAQDTERRLRELGDHWDVRRSPWSTAVWFRKPADDVVTEFFLATAELENDGAVAEYAIFQTMPPVTRERADRLITTLAGASPVPSRCPTRPAGVADSGPVRCLGPVPVDRRCL